ncbi:MAG: hypothetical protein ABIG69_07465, partial [Bacteroidota bacterium]
MNYLFRGIVVLVVLFLFHTSALAQGKEGTLDPTFNPVYKINTPMGASLDSATAIARDPNSPQFVQVGKTFNGSNYDFAVVRYDLSGNPASFFGKGGKVTLDISGDDIANDVKMTSDGKITVVGSSNGDFAIVKYISNGVLDPSFGTGGKVITDIGGTDAATAVVVLPSGKILVAGYSYVDAYTSYFMMVRYNANGELDQSFGDNGFVKKMPSFINNTHTLYATAHQNSRVTLLVQFNGRIIMNGTGYASGYYVHVMSKFESDGKEDSTFNNGNGTRIEVLTFASYAGVSAAALQSDGKVLVGGKFMGYPFVRRFDNGIVDSTFGENGSIIVPYNTEQAFGSVASIVIQTDDKIVVAGSTPNENNKYAFAAVRLNGSDGSIDETFSSDGRDITSIGDGTLHNICTGAIITNDGKIIMSGTHYLNSESDFGLYRYNSDGSIDTEFGSHGKITERVNFLSDDRIIDAKRMKDGNILLVGTTTYEEVQSFYVSRRDTTWKTLKYFWLDDHITFSEGPSVAKTSTVQSDGMIILGGKVTINGVDNIALARINGEDDGKLDSQFGIDGKVVIKLQGPSEVNGILWQGDGKILICGYKTTDSKKDLLLMRLNSDGSIDESYGSFGHAQVAEQDMLDIEAKGITSVSGKTFVWGISGSRDIALWSFEPRGYFNGIFGTNGMVTTTIGDSLAVNSFARQKNGKLVVAGNYINGINGRDGVVVRYNLDGTLDTEFSTDGIFSTDLMMSDEEFKDIVITFDEKIICGGTQKAFFTKDFFIMRLNSDGSVDNSFGDGEISGTSSTDFSGGTDIANSIVTQSDGKILLLGYTEGSADDDFAIARYLGAVPPPVENLVTFQVDMRAQSYSGKFNDTFDSVYVKGQLGAFTEILLTDGDFDGIFSATEDVGNITSIEYKFAFKSGSDTISEANSRNYQGLNGTPVTLPIVWFDDADMSILVVTFRANMKVQMNLKKFDKTLDTLIVRGDFNYLKENGAILTDEDGDSIYTGTFNVGYAPKNFYSKFAIISGTTGEILLETINLRKDLILTLPMTLPVRYFNDDSTSVLVENYVTFQVNMNVQLK